MHWAVRWRNVSILASLLLVLSSTLATDHIQIDRELPYVYQKAQSSAHQLKAQKTLTTNTSVMKRSVSDDSGSSATLSETLSSTDASQLSAVANLSNANIYVLPMVNVICDSCNASLLLKKLGIDKAPSIYADGSVQFPPGGKIPSICNIPAFKDACCREHCNSRNIYNAPLKSGEVSVERSDNLFRAIRVSTTTYTTTTTTTPEPFLKLCVCAYVPKSQANAILRMKCADRQPSQSATIRYLTAHQLPERKQHRKLVIKPKTKIFRMHEPNQSHNRRDPATTGSVSQRLRKPSPSGSEVIKKIHHRPITDKVDILERDTAEAQWLHPTRFHSSVRLEKAKQPKTELELADRHGEEVSAEQGPKDVWPNGTKIGDIIQHQSETEYREYQEVDEDEIPKKIVPQHKKKRPQLSHKSSKASSTQSQKPDRKDDDVLWVPKKPDVWMESLRHSHEEPLELPKDWLDRDQEGVNAERSVKHVKEVIENSDALSQIIVTTKSSNAIEDPRLSKSATKSEVEAFFDVGQEEPDVVDTTVALPSDITETTTPLSSDTTNVTTLNLPEVIYYMDSQPSSSLFQKPYISKDSRCKDYYDLEECHCDIKDAKKANRYIIYASPKSLRVSYFDAERKCAERGMMLLVVKDQMDYSVLYENAEPDTEYWMGLSRPGSVLPDVSEYRWLDGDRDTSFLQQHVDLGPQGGPEEYCTIMFTGGGKQRLVISCKPAYHTAHYICLHDVTHTLTNKA